MAPTVGASDLEDAVNAQFGCNIEDIRDLLFGDEYNNSCYKTFCYDEDEVYTGSIYEDEEEIRLRNLVCAYLRDVLPDYSYVLVDVSW
jgi:hypothetical protein